MTATALVRKLNTGDIEVMSNVTDLTVRGDRVSRLDSDRASATVHLSFTKELGLKPRPLLLGWIC